MTRPLPYSIYDTHELYVYMYFVTQQDIVINKKEEEEINKRREKNRHSYFCYKCYMRLQSQQQYMFSSYNNNGYGHSTVCAPCGSLHSIPPYAMRNQLHYIQVDCVLYNMHMGEEDTILSTAEIEIQYIQCSYEFICQNISD